MKYRLVASDFDDTLYPAKLKKVSDFTLNTMGRRESFHSFKKFLKKFSGDATHPPNVFTCVCPDRLP